MQTRQGIVCEGKINNVQYAHHLLRAQRKAKFKEEINAYALQPRRVYVCVLGRRDNEMMANMPTVAVA